MNRRTFLAIGGTTLTTGCSSQSDSGITRTGKPTPSANVTTITDAKTLPTPDGDIGRHAALSFVQTHEQRFVYNELVGGLGTSQPTIDINVGTAQVAAVHSTDQGYYLLSTCSGSAQYYDPDGSPSSATRNAASVAHFVGSNIHRRIPFNAYRCRDTIVTSPETDDRETTGARFQVYDFDTPPKYDQPKEGGHTVDVTVSNTGGEKLSRSYQTSLPLTVQPGVTETPGTYVLSATLNDASVKREWSLPESRTSSWWEVTVLVTNGGGVAVQSFYPNETVGLPPETLCGRER